MVYTRVWDNADPADGDPASAGAGEIREVMIDVQERLQGTAANGLIDLTGTRTIDSDPLQARPGLADTASLAAGGIGGLTRAATYFGLTTVAFGGGDYTHITGSAAICNQWEAVTGMTITIPAPPLGTTGIEHINGAAITSSDYVIFLVASFLCDITGTSGNDSTIYRIRNTTATTTVSRGDNAATGAGATHGVWSLQSSFFTGGLSDNSNQELLVIGRDTARTAATTYVLEAAAVSLTGGVPAGQTRARVRFSLADAQLFAIVFKR